MTRISTNYKMLFVAGLLLMSASFVLQHYVTLSDGLNGFLKGLALGLLILSVERTVKYKRQPPKTAE